MLIIVVTERLSANLVILDRDCAAKAAGRADRILGAIPTIKAFNAQDKESAAFESIVGKAYTAYHKLHLIYGVRGGATQFILLSMFVQGFWFGSYLVRDGRSTAAAVNTCFWACLLSATYLQLCLPCLLLLEKGKLGMVELLDLARPSSDEPAVVEPVVVVHEGGKDDRRGSVMSTEGFANKGIFNEYTIGLSNIKEDDMDQYATSMSSPSVKRMSIMSVSTPNTRSLTKKAGKSLARQLRKLRPTDFSGELSLRNVTFHYPSRPHPAAPALKNVHLYLASRETTYIVGGSGSGKSTVGNLLLGLYKPDSGKIEVDEQGLEWIDEEWLRGHVACVSQGASVIFDGSVHDNVAIGVVGQIRPDGTRRDPKDVTREEVTDACRGALVHEFVRDLPDGYDTWLSGEKGASLSGGQRQRLAIARAWIRNPTVLILGQSPLSTSSLVMLLTLACSLVLDEATSALDATSRLLVSEAIKLWRKNKTTIVITHDLSPIGAEDFVYVMTEGEVVEQGYRMELESNIGGPFCALAGIQNGPVAEEVSSEDEEEELDEDYFADSYSRFETEDHLSPLEPRHPSGFFSALFPSTGGVIAQGRELSIARKASAIYTPGDRYRKRASAQIQQVLDQPPSPPAYDYSLPNAIRRRSSTMSFSALNLAAEKASSRRPGGKRIKHKTIVDGDLIAAGWIATLKSEKKGKNEKSRKGDDVSIELDTVAPTMTIRQAIKRYYPTLPNKPLFWSGIFCCMIVGATTPIFSSLLSKLMAKLGDPTAGPFVIQTSLLILLIAAIDGAGTLMKFYILERCGMGWITALRIRALAVILKQDKAWFDLPENSTSNLVNTLIKDAEDARTLIGTIIGNVFVVVTMVALGLGWAIIVGWELTLVGVGLAPLFVFATTGQAKVISKFEGKNKRMREDVVKRFHQVHFP